MNPPPRRARLWLPKFVLLPLCLALVVELLFENGLFSPVDRRLQDFALQQAGQRGEARHVLIVAIDDRALAAWPDDPLLFWTDRLAEAAARLRAGGARAVGFDLLLSISPERWLDKLGAPLQQAAREHDRPLREQLHQGDLVLVATRSGPGSEAADYLLPSPDYLLALPGFDIAGHVGLADVLDEEDGVIRRFLLAPAPRAPADPTLPQLSFPALLALRAAGQAPATGRWQLAGRDLALRQPAEAIPYLGPPGTVPSVSLTEILSERPWSPELQALVRDRVVLIGGTAAGLNDEHFTPYATRLLSGRGPLMAGVEVQANIVEALLGGDRLQALPDNARRFALLLLALGAVALFARLPAALGGLVLAVALPALAWAGVAGMAHGLVLPVAPFAAVAALALLGILGWRLSGEERERARIRRLFGRYVSDQVVENLLQSGQVPQLGGQTQEMSVLFSDIHNFTSISEKLSAEEVVELLNTYFARACVPLLAEGGSIDKFIGDAVMVEFGSPLPVADHARRALRAAVALARVAEDFAGWVEQRFPDRDLPRFAVGIGVHSGEAVIGNIGAPNRMEFTAIGDMVNLASRLEGVTRAFGCTILASETTVAQAGGGVVCGRSEAVRVKGREQPVQVFEVHDVV